MQKSVYLGSMTVDEYQTLLRSIEHVGHGKWSSAEHIASFPFSERTAAQMKEFGWGFPFDALFGRQMNVII